MAREVRLPEEKLAQLRELLKVWENKRRCSKRELLSITGKLQYAFTVVQAGRTFVRRLFDLSTRVQRLDHHLKLNVDARSDLAWWVEFIRDWNGVSWLRLLGDGVPTMVLTSDASGWGVEHIGNKSGSN